MSTKDDPPKPAHVHPVIPPVTVLIRVAWVCYTVILLTATHWPKLAIKGPIERTDLVLHMSAFGLWTLLLGGTGWVCSRCCVARRALVVCLIGIGFGAFDETTQPFFQRVFDWTDLAADAAGAILASVVLLIVWSWIQKRKFVQSTEASAESVAHSPADTRS
ncbi:MAG: VanZ family protein [Phycisphaerales bacterium]